MYFRRILEVNLHLTDKLFSNESHSVFGATMSENHFRFLKGHICFDNPQEGTQLWETDRFAAVREIWEIFIQIFQSMLHHRNIFQLMRHYTQ